MSDKVYIAEDTQKQIKKLVKAEQVNDYVEKGWKIYERAINSTVEQLVVDPENGILKEIQIPIRSQTIMIRKV